MLIPELLTCCLSYFNYTKVIVISIFQGIITIIIKLCILFIQYMRISDDAVRLAFHVKEKSVYILNNYTVSLVPLDTHM